MLLSGGLLLAAVIREGGLDHSGFIMNLFGYSVLAAFFASFLMWTVLLPENSGFVWFASLRPLRALGRISYGLYVYHRLVPAAGRHPPSAAGGGVQRRLAAACGG